MKKTEKVVKTSDYIKVVIIVLFVVFTTLFLRNVYIKKVEYDNKISVLSDVIKKTIKDDEIYNYIKENDNSLIYICTSDEDKCRDFENGIKDAIRDNNYGENIVYLDITDVKNRDNFISKLNSYFNSEGIVNYPIFIYFKNGSVVDILNGDINENDLINFVGKCELD